MAKTTVPALPVTAAIYARYSSTAQNDASIEQQIEECSQYAAQNGLTIVSTYEDRAMTGRNDRRPGFQRMIRAAERGEFGTLLTYKSNRIARNVLDALRYEDKLDKAGVKVVYCKEDFGNNAAGRLALRLMMSVNEFYSDNLAEDVKRGLRDGAQKCQVVGSIPLGYKRGPDGKFAIDEPNAEVVREIFQRVNNGETFMSIARDLNARGIRTSLNKAWDRNSFHHMLANERYTGVYTFSDIRIEGGVPPIISRELFDAVQQLQKERGKSQSRYRGKNEFLLTGKLFCGTCLSHMVGVSGRSHNGANYYYYSCNGHRVGKKCNRRNIRKDLLEEQVVKCVQAFVLTDKAIKWITDGIEEMAKRQNEKSKLKYYEAKLADVKKQIANLVHALELGIVSDDVKERLDQLNEERQAIQGQIALEKKALILVDRDAITSALYCLRDGDRTNYNFQRHVVRNFVRAVYLYDGYFKLVTDFTGKCEAYKVEFDTAGIGSLDGNSEVPENSGSDDVCTCSYKESGSTPSFTYSNSCANGSVELLVRGFVVTWYFNM